MTHAKTINDPIFQPYIKGNEWSVDLYRSRQGVVIGCVARQRNLIAEGESQVTTTEVFSSIENICSQLADDLGIYGHAVFQLIEDDRGDLHLIECNPRFGGASTASLAVGLDSFHWFLCESFGIDLAPFVRSPGEVRQVRYPADWILPW